MTYHEILNILIFNRRKIFQFTLYITVLLFLILSFIYPVSYRSTVSILPPEKNSEMGGLSNLLGGQDFTSLVTGGLNNANSQLFIEILKSRSAALYVVKKHNLKEYYNEKSDYEAADQLNQKLAIELTKEGIVMLNVEITGSLFPVFTDEINSLKKMSADLSNSYVEALDKINREKLSSKAKKARQYIETQILKTKASLDSVEFALMEFQRINKTIALPEQLKASIESAAKLKTEIIKTEIELGMMQTNLREDNKTLLSLKDKLEELQSQYNKMEIGSHDYLLAFSEVPQLGKHLASLLREVKIQNEVYLLLQQQYYKESIQENRDLPTVEILDEAILPLKASGPRTIFSSILGGICSFLFISLLFVLNEKKINKYKPKGNA